MSVDLQKYGSQIKEACSQVVSGKDEADWAMFGYEGQTNVIKLVSTGRKECRGDHEISHNSQLTSSVRRQI